ncbi:MAG: DUF3604 domain-containing protein [Planctomycetaceae bacterium]
MTNALGQAAIAPDSPVTAGRYGTWRLTYTAGESGIAQGGGLRVDTDTDSDWGTPQFVDPQAAEYTTVEAPPGVQPVVRTTGVKSLVVTVQGRKLEPGESISLVIGDTAGGSPGSRAQTFVEERRWFWIDVDADGSGNWQALADSPRLRIVADDTERLVATAVPSTLAVGESFRVVLKAEDRWGNPATSYRGTVELSGEGFACQRRRADFTADDAGVKWIEDCKAEIGGVLRIAATDTADELRADANPVVVTARPGDYQLNWADPHGGQLVHREKFAGFFRYARDVAGVQFVGFQRNADVISADDWEEQQRQERAFTETGRFIPIPGFEWSGRTAEGGHHNVYFRRQGQPARRNLPAEEMFQAERVAPELPHATDLYAAYRNTDTIITPHVGGEHSDISYHEPTLEPAVEVTSTHGSFEWMLFDSLKRGYRMGFLGGSDCYTGRPGDDRPGHQLRRYAKSGLTGIYVKDVSLESFFEAMRARRVFATTGARMVVSLDADGHVMGSEYSTGDPPTISAAVAGTAPLDRVDLFRGTELVYSHPLEGEAAPNKVRILWTGASRMTSYSGVIWDGTAQVSGAAINNVRTIRFDSPRSHIVEHSPTELRWHAWGCGYLMGVELEFHEFDDPADVELQISVGTRAITGPGFGGHGNAWPKRVSFAPAEGAAVTVRLSDVLEEDREVPLDVLERRMFVWSAPEDRPLSADFQVLDDKPSPGFTPYWLRVIQLDGEAAWSSPVFVDYAGEA